MTIILIHVLSSPPTPQLILINPPLSKIEEVHCA